MKRFNVKTEFFNKEAEDNDESLIDDMKQRREKRLSKPPSALYLPLPLIIGINYTKQV